MSVVRLECDRESPIMMGPLPTGGGVGPWKGKSGCNTRTHNFLCIQLLIRRPPYHDALWTNK